MSNDIVKHTPRPLDSFADFDTSTEGDDGERFAGTLRGIRLKFTNEATWETANGADFSDHELVAVDLRRMEVKWGDGKPLPETRELGPGERYRNLEALNASCPKSEWREGFDGKLHGPWQHQHVLELVDPVSMDCFSYPASTIGGSIAVSNLRDSIMRMRQFGGDGTYPLVQLSHTHMKTRFGGRERPYFLIKRWIRLGGDGAKAVGAASPALLPSSVGSVVENAPTVAEPTLREETGDSIPF